MLSPLNDIASLGMQLPPLSPSLSLSLKTLNKSPQYISPVAARFSSFKPNLRASLSIDRSIEREARRFGLNELNLAATGEIYCGDLLSVLRERESEGERGGNCMPRLAISFRGESTYRPPIRVQIRRFFVLRVVFK